MFAWVTFTSGGWEGILSGCGGTYEHPSQYFSYQEEKKSFRSTQIGGLLVDLEQLQDNNHIISLEKHYILNCFIKTLIQTLLT